MSLRGDWYQRKMKSVVFKTNVPDRALICGCIDTVRFDVEPIYLFEMIYGRFEIKVRRVKE
ncbi:MAG: hypothetical protein CME31_14825 [Gimesia sp.]|uniref:Uncharacterized protein n=1 Tax=Gimesia maris TaxID=122 RepID=A0A3D3R725_9PLAN|nr:hypothetical protein [Gimesia sp.]HCO23862.1 hypothetical protein [Gimesia maris]